MKYFFLACCFVSLIIFTGCSRSKKHIMGSGNVISQERALKGFNKVLFSGNGNLYIAQGDKESVRLEGDDNIINLMTTEVVDDTLRIDFKKSSMVNYIHTSEPVKIFIQTVSLQEIRLSGSGSVVGTAPLKVNFLKLSISGSGIVDLHLIGHKLVSISSGSGNFSLKGVVENQDVWISGSGVYQAEQLRSKVANINISGVGKVFVTVEDDIDVRISGSGNVVYQGNPRLRQTILGTGQVLQKESSK